MKKIQEADIKNKNVLLRIDTDVPIENGVVLDGTRLKASIKTIKYLLENGAKLTIIGHLGRPASTRQSSLGGPKGNEVHKLKIRPVEDKLIELLGTHQNWQILENLRFSSGEEINDEEFARQLAAGQDIFVQDAFATCHRNHASTVGVTKLLPSYAGMSVQKEVENLSKILESSSEGFTLIIGGKKVQDKLPVIENLFNKVQNVLVGGVVGNTFLASRGINLGKSLIETHIFKNAEKIIQEFDRHNDKKLSMPMDIIFSKSLDAIDIVETVDVNGLSNIQALIGVDIGPETRLKFTDIINQSKTIFWNGNMGISEIAEFSIGTEKIAEAIANSKAKKYAGGGDTTSFIRKMNLEDKFDFLSTGGGATLEFLAGKILPGLEVLK